LAKLIPQYHIPLYTLPVKALRGKSFIQKLLFPYYLIKSIYLARKIIKQLNPDLIISMGGYVAGPGGLAAKLCGIPLIIHEQNSIAGMTNKFLSKFATKIFTAFPDTLPNCILVGNPVRKNISTIIKIPNTSTTINLLIIGGSRGAKIFNDIIPEAIKLLPENIRPNVFHQTGETGSADYENIPATVLPFINNISEQYAWADLIICRGGALTLAEITSVGIPAILIPAPFAVDDHQTKNAEYLVKNQAAVLLPQAEFTSEKLAELLKAVILDPDKRLAMATSSRGLRKENAAEKMVEILLGEKK
jgi:UDP-N-acetylglucosamine--N-acetylmuramyl-(pentapeptide) pyrophosphoryl-undecaprenol N-acetylglucosamine transferase